jgi:hypothetical protein
VAEAHNEGKVLPAEPVAPTIDPHREHWGAIAEASEVIAASPNCGPAEARALCDALDRLTAAELGESTTDERVAFLLGMTREAQAFAAKYADEVVELRAALASSPSLTAAARDVLGERHRQVEVEGWTPEHDDEHGDGDLAAAAACYSLNKTQIGAYILWPWNSGWWKPRDTRSNLVRAAALLLAEIERLDRAAPQTERGA